MGQVCEGDGVGGSEGKQGKKKLEADSIFMEVKVCVRVNV